MAITAGGDQGVLTEGNEQGRDAGGLRAVRQGAAVAGVASANKLDQIYACLYGIHGASPISGDLPERFTPVIPDAVDYLGIGQLRSSRWC